MTNSSQWKIITFNSYIIYKWIIFRYVSHNQMVYVQRSMGWDLCWFSDRLETWPRRQKRWPWWKRARSLVTVRKMWPSSLFLLIKPPLAVVVSMVEKYQWWFNSQELLGVDWWNRRIYDAFVVPGSQDLWIGYEHHHGWFRSPLSRVFGWFSPVQHLMWDALGSEIIKTLGISRPQRP